MTEFTCSGNVISIRPEDEYGVFNLLEAKMLCDNLQKEGWRIPTADELLCIYETIKKSDNKTSLDELKISRDATYLTDSYSFDDFPLSFDFNDGRTYMSLSEDKHKLRLIRGN